MNSELTSRDAAWRQQLRQSHSPRQRSQLERVKMNELTPEYRVGCNDEVNQGLSPSQAMAEAIRCLDCAEPGCVQGCPVRIDIPAFIKNVELGDFQGAAEVLKQSSALPAVCGRVCPQERQCESKCIYNRMKKPPVAIGYLERFAADTDQMIRRAQHSKQTAQGQETGSHDAARRRVAVVGSGPAGLSFAGDMARRGYAVTVFEALHEIGGVLKYGIPEFRLPNAVVDTEIDALRQSGVEFVGDCVIGKTLSYDDLMAQGYEGVFVASGAGLPRFMGIPGENLIGVMSCNEYLTRINLMGAGRPNADTPVMHGHTVAVIGGGNTAMDAVRTARRMGAERAVVIYRRSEAEMPARVEEVHHARQEGVEFMTLHNPVEYLGDEKGRVRAVRVQRMELGEPDQSGRRSPVPVEGAIEEWPVDMVIVSVGVSPNPLVPQNTPGLEMSRRGTIVVDEKTMKSSLDRLYAGGDIVRGGATVILAMGDGRRAAAAMDEELNHLPTKAL